MKMLRHLRSFAFLAALIAPCAAFAQTAVLDQIPAPAPSASNTNQNSELYLQSYSVPGGTLYSHVLKQAGQGGAVIGVADTFVPTAASGKNRYRPIVDAVSDAGISLTASATAGAMGIARTAGTSLVLAGEATSSSAKTDKAAWNFSLADSYVAGAALPCVINANYTGSGTVTAANTTLTLAAYTEVNGVETAIAGITAAQQFTATGANYTFTIPGAGLTPGAQIMLEIVMLVTTSAGAATGQINAVYLTM